jgi:hypothetical protein
VIPASYDPDYKVCNICSENKKNEEYASDKRNLDGLCSYCRECKTVLTRQPKNHIDAKYRQLIFNYKKDNIMPKSEFVGYYLNNSLYKTLHNNWEESDYNKDLSPSFTRKDINSEWIFDNILILTKKSLDNIITKRSIEGNINTGQKRVGAFKDNELILEFVSVRDTERKGFTKRNVFRCLSGERNTHGGYEWKYLT